MPFPKDRRFTELLLENTQKVQDAHSLLGILDHITPINTPHYLWTH